ncbi:MAG: CAP domain-containing protein [Acidobacteriota bacterium]
MKWDRWNKSAILWLIFSGLFFIGGPFSSTLIPHAFAANAPISHETAVLVPLDAGEQEMLAIVNRERTRHGLPALDIDGTLMNLARKHSQEMAEQGFISHEEPSGSLQSRMDRIGYHYEVARENVASSQTVVRAHQALLNSPPHKLNLLASDVTHIGIGVVQRPSPCGHYLYITQVFAAPRKAYEPAVIQNILKSRIQDLRRNGSGAMDSDPLLEKLASRSLLSLRTPYDRTELRDLIAASADELHDEARAELSQLQVSVQLVHDPKNISIPDSKREGLARKYGTAIRRITDNRNQPAFLVLTLLGITR